MQKVQVRLGRWHSEEVAGSEREWKASLVLLALGFLGPQQTISKALNVKQDDRSNYDAAHGHYETSAEGVFAAGDCRRGQSLVVWAIAEGRETARAIDLHLMGATSLPHSLPNH